jgi:hypothetical protein
VTVPTLIVVLMVSRALSPGASEFEVVSLILVANLLALGILEHWFLVLPLPDEALWAWALPSREADGEMKNPSGQGGTPPDGAKRRMVACGNLSRPQPTSPSSGRCAGAAVTELR